MEEVRRTAQAESAVEPMQKNIEQSRWVMIWVPEENQQALTAQLEVRMGLTTTSGRVEAQPQQHGQLHELSRHTSLVDRVQAARTTSMRITTATVLHGGHDGARAEDPAGEIQGGDSAGQWSGSSVHLWRNLRLIAAVLH